MRKCPRAAAAQHHADRPPGQPPCHAGDVAAAIAAGGDREGARGRQPLDPARPDSPEPELHAVADQIAPAQAGAVAAGRTADAGASGAGSRPATTASTRSARDRQNSSHALVLRRRRTPSSPGRDRARSARPAGRTVPPPAPRDSTPSVAAPFAAGRSGLARIQHRDPAPRAQLSAQLVGELEHGNTCPDGAQRDRHRPRARGAAGSRGWPAAGRSARA